MLSVIIPTRNEEKYVGRLLGSLHKQKFSDLEIIVGDADSNDRTRTIAESYGAVVTGGGLCPAIGRNMGAKVASGENMLFLDADVLLPDSFLERNCREFIERKLDIATTFVRPISNKKVDRLIFYAINKGYILFEKISPAAHGYHIFVKRELFDRVGGFDEKIILNDDLDFVQRVWRAGGKFGVLRGPEIYVSVRRLKKEGRAKFVLKGLYGLSRYMLGIPMYPGSRFSVRYEFNGYDGVEEEDFVLPR